MNKTLSPANKTKLLNDIQSIRSQAIIACDGLKDIVELTAAAIDVAVDIQTTAAPDWPGEGFRLLGPTEPCEVGDDHRLMDNIGTWSRRRAIGGAKC